MREKPHIVNASVVCETRLFSIEELELKFSNGVEARYERLKVATDGTVLIVPLLDERTVLLIIEYAAGTHEYELCLPKGRINAGENHMEAANRELMEELGYGAKRLHSIRSVTIAPGYIGTRTHVVLARELYKQKLLGDEPEDIEIVPWPLDQLDALLSREDFTEARSIAALFIVRDLLDKERSCLHNKRLF